MAKRKSLVRLAFTRGAVEMHVRALKLLDVQVLAIAKKENWRPSETAMTRGSILRELDRWIAAYNELSGATLVHENGPTPEPEPEPVATAEYKPEPEPTPDIPRTPRPRAKRKVGK